MKRVSVVFVIFLLASSASAQYKQQTIDQAKAREAARNAELERRMMNLRMLDQMRNDQKPEFDAREIYRYEVRNNIRKLSEARDRLIAAYAATTEKRDREISKCAEKVAKLSNSLRRRLSEGKVEKATATTADCDLNAAANPLAANICKLIEEIALRQDEILWTTDATNNDRTSKTLADIEKDALAIYAHFEKKAR